MTDWRIAIHGMNIINVAVWLTPSVKGAVVQGLNPTWLGFHKVWAIALRNRLPAWFESAVRCTPVVAF